MGSSLPHLCGARAETANRRRVGSGVRQVRGGYVARSSSAPLKAHMGSLRAARKLLKTFDAGKTAVDFRPAVSLLTVFIGILGSWKGGSR